MGKKTGFIEYSRIASRYRPIEERVKDYNEVSLGRDPADLSDEGARCMDCGVPFCHSLGCPLYNLIPEWNDAVYRNKWREAWERLNLTNNFPEITGRICPALCEASCTLAIHGPAVSIKEIERAITEKAFAEGWVVPRPPVRESGKRVAVIGSGPAGLAAAQQLRRAGHGVSLFEKSSKIGGLLRYGIPDFKLDKGILDRRLEQLSREGVEFEADVVIGEDISVRWLRKKYDALVLALGAGEPRDIAVPGRHCENIHYALEYLTHSNKVVSDELAVDGALSASGKRVLIIGGGDTGADCMGTAIRQGAKEVLQVEILPEPPVPEDGANPEWPRWPRIKRSSSSHEEGGTRLWSVSVDRFISGYYPRIQKAHIVPVDWVDRGKGLQPVPDTSRGYEIETDMVLIAAGFVHTEHSTLLESLEVDLDNRGNISVDTHLQTSVPGIFAAGDARAGAGLVVRAMADGRQVAETVHQFLCG